MFTAQLGVAFASAVSTLPKIAVQVNARCVIGVSGFGSWARKAGGLRFWLIPDCAGVRWRQSGRLMSANPPEHVAVGDGVTGLLLAAFEGAGPGRADGGFHFHRFQYGQGVAFGDFSAVFGLPFHQGAA